MRYRTRYSLLAAWRLLVAAACAVAAMSSFRDDAVTAGHGWLAVSAVCVWAALLDISNARASK